MTEADLTIGLGSGGTHLEKSTQTRHLAPRRCQYAAVAKGEAWGPAEMPKGRQGGSKAP